MLPIVTIIGRPNSGKSRLFNRLLGQKKAIVSDISGTTRDRIMEIKETKIPYYLVDTAGLNLENLEEEQDIFSQVKIALLEADLVIILLDASKGLREEDKDFVRYIYKKQLLKEKNCIFCLSKCDYLRKEEDIAEFYSLGIDNFIQISAVHKLGIKELERAILKKLPKKIDYIKPETELPKISVVGRPNTGKSSFLNALINQERFIVSEKSGTTRDANSLEIEFEGEKYCFVDTAGVRKRGKIEKGIEKWALSRTLQNLEVSDIACLFIDAKDGVVAQDQHIYEYLTKVNTGVIIVVNKWDLMEKGEIEEKKFLLHLRQKFPFLSWAPVLFVSAKNKKNLQRIFVSINAILKERQITIPTGKLNNYFKKMIARNAPRGTKRALPKIYYATQTGVNPPNFKIFVNKKELFHFSYFRYIENFLREHFGFWGTPIKFDVVDKEKNKF
jgi:GTP-binding protein